MIFCSMHIPLSRAVKNGDCIELSRYLVCVCVYMNVCVYVIQVCIHTYIDSTSTFSGRKEEIKEVKPLSLHAMIHVISKRFDML